MNPFLAYDHVQLAMPAGEEERARHFYVAVCGMIELRKPAELRARGGVWFASGTVALHLGVEAHFTPARKAHPALRCSDLATLQRALEANGYPTTSGGIFEDGLAHVYVSDPFGNRIELIG